MMHFLLFLVICNARFSIRRYLSLDVSLRAGEEVISDDGTHSYSDHREAEFDQKGTTLQSLSTTKTKAQNMETMQDDSDWASEHLQNVFFSEGYLKVKKENHIATIALTQASAGIIEPMTFELLQTGGAVVFISKQQPVIFNQCVDRNVTPLLSLPLPEKPCDEACLQSFLEDVIAGIAVTVNPKNVEKLTQGVQLLAQEKLNLEEDIEDIGLRRAGLLLALGELSAQFRSLTQNNTLLFEENNIITDTNSQLSAQFRSLTQNNSLLFEENNTLTDTNSQLSTSFFFLIFIVAMLLLVFGFLGNQIRKQLSKIQLRETEVARMTEINEQRHQQLVEEEEIISNETNPQFRVQRFRELYKRRWEEECAANFILQQEILHLKENRPAPNTEVGAVNSSGNSEEETNIDNPNEEDQVSNLMAQFQHGLL